LIPMSELVKDPTYRRFLETKPKTPRFSRDQKMQSSPPWVVYVQREQDGKWGKKEFWKYSEAFKFFRGWLKKGAHDATINNKRYPTPPPERLVRIKGKFVTDSKGVRRQATKYIKWTPRLTPEDPLHHWCMYCRRPTVFKYFTKHKRLGQMIDPTVRRCCICGASERIAIPANERRIA
jgi:hypothetical protein